MDLRSRERADWTSGGKLKGTVNDFNKVREALDFLREKGISTVGSLDAYLDEVSGKVVSIRSDVRKTERRIKAIDAALSHIRNHDAHRAVYKEYASIGWKKKRRNSQTLTGKNWTLTLPPSVISKPMRRSSPLTERSWTQNAGRFPGAAGQK